MASAIITTVIHRVSNLFRDFDSDRKSFRCRPMSAKNPHRNCVVNTLKLKISIFLPTAFCDQMTISLGIMGAVLYV